MGVKMSEYEYYPSKERKEIIDKKCNDCISALGGLDINEKAFALMVLVDSFQKVSGMNLIAIMSSKKNENAT